MTLSAGSRLGPYEILSVLGAGGMGEVYRARDTRLGRDVAIKVLPEELARDPERLRRFEGEARAASALSDPHIVAVFDVGEAEGVHYFATELVEGSDLRHLLDGGPMPLKKALDLAGQIASGLAAAHEKGIVHRDLKPENILITKSGLAKIADFGLAKLTESKAKGVSQLPTSDGHQTTAGVVMGTITYMSPEQVKGLPVDHRSDIFSFGSVLYEMLTGQKAFQRGTGAETMAAILKEEPPVVSSLQPPALDHVVRNCLAKVQNERWQSAADVASQLRWIGEARPVSPVRTGGRRREVALWAAFILASLAVLALGLRLSGLRSAVEPTFRRMSFRSKQTIFQAAFAPDGETIVYSAALEGNVPELFVIRPEYPEPRPLGLSHTHLLSISSKGELAVLTNARFIAQRLFIGTLSRVSLGGTAPREILEDVRQADWSPDGSELAIIRTAEGKDRLEFPIGKVLYEAAGYLSDLRVSPRGDRIALFEHPKQWDDRGSVIVVDRAGKRTVLSGEYGGGVEGLAWSQTGDEIFFSTTKTVFGVDLSGHRRVALRSAGGLTMHDVSRAGRWLVTQDAGDYGISALAPGASAERDLSWLNASMFPFLSRDGRTLLFTDGYSAAGSNYSVCLRTTIGGPVVILGEGRAFGLSPDGKWALAVIFTPPQLVIYPTGPGAPRRLARGNLETYRSASWFPDGRSVLVAGNEAGKASRCYEQDVSGGAPRPVTPEAATNGTVSPDSQQILYSKPGGGYFLQRAAGRTAQPVAGLTSDDQVIRWSVDGRSLYVFRPANVPFRIERLDLVSGRRELVREVAPADRAGVLNAWGAALSDDTRTYAYGYARMMSQLFVVEGAR